MASETSHNMVHIHLSYHFIQTLHTPTSYFLQATMASFWSLNAPTLDGFLPKALDSPISMNALALYGL